MNQPLNPQVNSGDNETPDLSPLAQSLIQNEAPDVQLRALLQELEETAEELRTELEAREGTRHQLHEDAAAGADAGIGADTGTGTAGTGTGTAAEEAGRPHRKVNPNVTPEQEEELKNFPEYWANSKGSWSNLFKLLREFRTEMKKGRDDA